MSDRELFVVEQKLGDNWHPLSSRASRTEECAALDLEFVERTRGGELRVVRYVPDDATGDAFAAIVEAGCQGGVRTEGGSWICEITNERGDVSRGYGPLAPAGERQVGAREAVEMALKNFPRGVR